MAQPRGFDFLTGIDAKVKEAKASATAEAPKPLVAKLIKPGKVNPFAHAELFRRTDRLVATRERRLGDLNCDLANAMSHREILAMTGEGTEYDPIKLAPSFGTGKHLAKLLNAATGEKSYASAESMANMGSHYRRVVDMGCHKESNPRAIGKYQTPEVVTVTRNGEVTKQGESFRLAAEYRNQNGNPMSDYHKTRTQVTSKEYRKRQRAFRKVFQGMTASTMAQSREDNAVFVEAGEKSLTDYRKYFR